MNKLRLVLACTLLLIPISGMAARVQSGQNGGSIPVYFTHFTFTLTIDSQGDGISPVFSNRTGEYITAVTITPQNGAYTSEQNDCTITVYFSGCTPPVGNDGDWFFFGPPGIPPAGAIPGLGEFNFSFFGFNPGTWQVEGTLQLASQVPEPTTLLLIGPALAGLWVKRRALSR